MSDFFVGRQYELKQLAELEQKRTASLVVVYGRRRIGKSRLVEEFGKGKRFYSFAGLYPDKGTTAQDQLRNFYYRFVSQFDIKPNMFEDWVQAFHYLAQQTRQGKVVILLDEITWMSTSDQTFLGKLKNAWDLEFKQNPQLTLVLCGSVSQWIEKNLLANQGFYGRISLKIQLGEQPLSDCNQYWHYYGNNLISDYDKLKILSVTGGIPKYLEEINPNRSADDNIKRLCFEPSGLLFNDYHYIFSSMLERDSELYRQIVEVLCQHNKQRKDILAELNKKSGGVLSAYIDELEVAGFIARDYAWNLKTGHLSKLSQYRLSDNYLRFYIQYILPALSKIKHQQFNWRSLNSLPGWATIMGLQIENLILNNRQAIQSLMDIHPDEVICDGPFFQRKTTKTAGCQIDYLIQSRLGVLYICEVKFTRSILRASIIQDVQNKIKRLTVPRNMSVVPVLLHVGDVHDEVFDASFFGHIININQLLYR